MALLLHYTGQDYISRGLLKTELTPGSTSAIVGGCKTGNGFSFTNNNVSDAYTSMTTVNDNQLSISAWIRTNANSITGNRFTILQPRIPYKIKFYSMYTMSIDYELMSCSMIIISTFAIVLIILFCQIHGIL